MHVKKLSHILSKFAIYARPQESRQSAEAMPEYDVHKVAIITPTISQSVQSSSDFMG